MVTSRIVGNVQFRFLAESTGCGVLCVFAHLKTDAFRAIAPFQVICAFGMPFFFLVYNHSVGLDAAIGREHDGAIARPVRGLDSFGEIDLPVGHRVIPSDSGISVGITNMDNKGNGGEGGIRTLGTGVSPYNGLANRRIRPLCHLSKPIRKQLEW